MQIQGTGAINNEIIGNHIGTDVSGTLAIPNLFGIRVEEGARENVLGGAAGLGNIISGNWETGILIRGVGTANNQVLGNFIGTDATGMASLGNLRNGIIIEAGAQDNWIGSDEIPGTGNIISGNLEAGVIIRGMETRNTHVLRNFIGTDSSGTSELSNKNGIVIEAGAQDNTIGGDMPDAYNVISGNEEAGILIQDSETDINEVIGNYIGTNFVGEPGLGNHNGVVIKAGAQENYIGPNNLISSNGESGIRLQGGGTQNNYIEGNDIVNNTVYGIIILDGASSNTIGSGNTITHNGDSGVAIVSETVIGNTITRNVIHSNGGLPVSYPAPTPLHLSGN